MENAIGPFSRFRPPAKPTILCLTALTALFSLLSTTDCSFMRSSVGEDVVGNDRKVGLFSQMIVDEDGHKLGCVRYPSKDAFDSMFKAGRAFGVLTVMCSCTALLLALIVLTALPKCSNTLWMTLNYLLMGATVTQMFTFFSLGSDFVCSEKDCPLAGVGVLAAFNVVIMGLLSIWVYLEDPPEKQWLTWWEEEDLQEQQRQRESSVLELNPQVSEFLAMQQSKKMNEETKAPESNGVQRIQPSGPTGWCTVSELGTNSSVHNDVGVENSVINVEEQGIPGDRRFREFTNSTCREHPPPSFLDRNGNTAAPTLQVQASGSFASYDTQQDDNDSVYSVVGVQSMKSFRLIMLSLFIFAWSVTLAGVDKCSFILVGPVGGDLSSFTGIGLFKRSVYNSGKYLGCIEYPDKTKRDFDPVFLTSRVFAAVAAMLMTVVVILNVVQLFFNCAKEEIWIVIRLLLPCATLFQVLVFLVYKTETCSYDDLIACVPGQLGIWVILNVVLMVILSILVLLMPPPPHPLFARFRATDETHKNDSAQISSIASITRERNSILDSSSLKMVKDGQRNQPEVFYPGDDEDGNTAFESHEGDHDHNSSPPERIIRINPVPPPQPAELITVAVEYNGNEKKIIKTLTHPDGSKTITTTIEELVDDNTAMEEVDLEDSSEIYDDHASLSSPSYDSEENEESEYERYDNETSCDEGEDEEDQPTKVVSSLPSLS